MTRNQEIETLLRSLDAADRLPVDAGRARADLRRILSAPAPAPAPAPVPVPQHRPPSARFRGGAPRAMRRAGLLGGLVAAATAILVVLPSVSGGDPAFATWTAAPSGMTERERADAAAECRESKKGVGDGMYAQDVAAAAVAIAERRGAWTTVILTGEGGFSAMCITDDSAYFFTKSMIGSVGKSTDIANRGPRELTATALGTGTMGAGKISLAAGTVGSEVVGVSYRSRAHEDVAATVSYGHFALWLPGAELQDASTDGVNVDVTYKDGTAGTSRLNL